MAFSLRRSTSLPESLPEVFALPERASSTVSLDIHSDQGTEFKPGKFVQ
ncbi:MAG: hypothetical protein S4CHLAM7_00940 [Chlamydiae bacterium]|nr:hypothetical protein [Chlamydiota bacterium]